MTEKTVQTTVEKLAQSRFDALAVTIRPVVNGWTVKRGTVWFVAKTEDEAIGYAKEQICQSRKMFLADLRRNEIKGE